MKEEVLLQAIGGLDESILAESEETIAAKPKRILWRTLIVAATLAMLTIGVAAAPPIAPIIIGGVSRVFKNQPMNSFSLLFKAF